MLLQIIPLNSTFDFIEPISREERLFLFIKKEEKRNLHCISKKIAIVAWASRRYLARYKEIRGDPEEGEWRYYCARMAEIQTDNIICNAINIYYIPENVTCFCVSLFAFVHDNWICAY